MILPSPLTGNHGSEPGWGTGLLLLTGTHKRKRLVPSGEPWPPALTMFRRQDGEHRITDRLQKTGNCDHTTLNLSLVAMIPKLSPLGASSLANHTPLAGRGRISIDVLETSATTRRNSVRGGSKICSPPNSFSYKENYIYF